MAATLPADVELVIVDNASTDDGAATGVATRPDAIVVPLKENIGFGGGCQAGVASASGDVLVFFNPDCRAEPGAIERLALAVLGEPSSIFGPALLNADGSVRHDLRRRSRPLDEMLESLPSARRWMPAAARRDLPATDPRYRLGGEVDYLQGACLAITRECFERAGGFDDDYFLYSEEESLCSAVRKAGGRCIYLAEAKVRHVGGTSTEAVRELAAYHHFRSRAIFYRKRDGELRGQLAIAAIATTTALSWLLNPLPALLGRRTAQPDHFHRVALHGLRDGALFRVGALERA
jgi:N-acetylglucosaminyl-diphospho-decaprenol L-rhamnosyltransferase